jgi:hypothetical protein
MIREDYEKTLKIIRNEDNESKHINSIINFIFLFKNKWLRMCNTTEEILDYTEKCLTIDDEYEKLRQKIYGTKI